MEQHFKNVPIFEAANLQTIDLEMLNDLGIQHKNAWYNMKCSRIMKHFASCHLFILLLLSESATSKG